MTLDDDNNGEAANEYIAEQRPCTFCGQPATWTFARHCPVCDTLRCGLLAALAADFIAEAGDR